MTILAGGGAHPKAGSTCPPHHTLPRRSWQSVATHRAFWLWGKERDASHICSLSPQLSPRTLGRMAKIPLAGSLLGTRGFATHLLRGSSHLVSPPCGGGLWARGDCAQWSRRKWENMAAPKRSDSGATVMDRCWEVRVSWNNGPTRMGVFT